jgi:predicted type IV restriction endonuclease
MSYCPQVGSEYACVTNGTAFILFRAFIRGRDYSDADALVISSLTYFAKSFTAAYNLLAYEPVTRSRSLHIALDSQRGSRELYYPNGVLPEN